MLATPLLMSPILYFLEMSGTQRAAVASRLATSFANYGDGWIS